MGGGISGLTTAYQMVKQGYDVTVIEAANGLGGHMQTSQSGFDMGAQLISTREKGIIALATELGVELDPPVSALAGKTPSQAHEKVEDEEPTLFHINGQLHSEEDIAARYRPLANILEGMQVKLRKGEEFTDFARQLDSMSMDEFLAQHPSVQNVFATNEDRDIVHKALKQAMHAEFGDTSKLSALAFVDYIGTKEIDGVFNMLGESDEAYQYANGAGSLIKALETKLKEAGVEFQTNTKVTGIQYDANAKGINLKTQSGYAHSPETQHFDYAVSALSLQNLRNVEGIENLGLSNQQLDAIRGTEYANLVKICIPTKSDDFACELYMDMEELGLPTKIIGWQNGEGHGGEKGSVTFYCADFDASRKDEIIALAKEKYAKAVGSSVESVFTNNAPEIANWQGAGKGCFSAPTVGQYVNQHTLRDIQTPAPFGIVTEAVPYLYESQNKDRGTIGNTGCMNNAVEAANRQTERAVQQMQGKQASDITQHLPDPAKEAQKKKMSTKMKVVLSTAAAAVVIATAAVVWANRHKPDQGRGR